MSEASECPHGANGHKWFPMLIVFGVAIKHKCKFCPAVRWF